MSRARSRHLGWWSIFLALAAVVDGVWAAALGTWMPVVVDALTAPWCALLAWYHLRTPRRDR